MTKTELLDQLTAGTGLTRIEVAAVVEGFLDLVADSLQKGESVDLRGFGSFRVRERAPRVSRNPSTNEVIQVGARFVPVFKPSKDLRNSVHGSLAE